MLLFEPSQSAILIANFRRTGRGRGNDCHRLLHEGRKAPAAEVQVHVVSGRGALSMDADAAVVRPRTNVEAATVVDLFAAKSGSLSSARLRLYVEPKRKRRGNTGWPGS